MTVQIGRTPEEIADLADLLGVPLRPEHLEEVAAAWRLMAPHRRLVSEAELTLQAEPAALFRP